VRKTFALVLCCFSLAACAAVSGSSAGPGKVSLESTPPGAHASLSSFGSCTTPCTLPAPDKAGDYNVTFGLAGYAPLTIPIHATANRENWFLSDTTVEPNPVQAVLQPTAPSARLSR